MNPLDLAQPLTEDFFDVHGFFFRFRTNQPDARRLIGALYQRFPETSRGKTAIEALIDSHQPGVFHWRVADNRGTVSDLRAALWNLEAALCEAIIKSQQYRMALHASTICAGNSATLLVGQSGAGKTTLSLALARRGLAVATDDVALMEPETSNISPIPRCFHLDDQSVALLEADGLRLPPSWKQFSFMVPDELAVRAAENVRAKILVFMSAPRAEHPLITPIPQAEMAARLLSETGQGPLDDPEIVQGLCRLAGKVACYSLIPGPLAETADALAQLVLDREA